MDLQVRSWSRTSKIPNLIGKKKVDYSIFEYGTTIPIEFYKIFRDANGGEMVPVGESRNLILIYEDTQYNARLTNVNITKANRSSLQIRYDSNKELKQLLLETFKFTHSYIKERRAQGKGQKDQVVLPNEIAEYIEFYSTGVPYRYEMKFFTNQRVSIPKIWWVNQGSTLEIEKKEGILWAPIMNKNGQSGIYHWETMGEVKKGDIILHYSNGALRYISQVTNDCILAPKPQSLVDSEWQQEGRLVQTEYHPLNPSIPLDKFSSEIMRLKLTQGPIHSGGGVKQGYLFRFSIQGLKIIQSKSPETVWPAFSLIEGDEDPMFELSQYAVEENNDDIVHSTIQSIRSFIAHQGFRYSDHLIENFYLSLKTKPFVILAGISGTGKTKLVKLFAEALGATNENKQFTLIPVRPDWSDPSDLLGYKDLKDDFNQGPMTEVLLEASQPANRHKPYFICLDEMNLARVEHYFSDILSILETRRKHGHQLVTDTLLTKEKLNHEHDLIIPENVYIVGTVNMDETTHPFSKKVLDRANTIEFNYIQLDDYPDPVMEETEPSSILVSNNFLRSEYLQLKDAYSGYQELIQRTTQKLVQINRILEDIHSHIGFRVRDSICFYMIYNERFSLLKEDDAFDLQLLQKIMPRIQGSSRSIKRALIELLQMCLNQKLNTEKLLDDASELHEQWWLGGDTTSAVYPKSARKLVYMLRRLEEDGFTSFWLS